MKLNFKIIITVFTLGFFISIFCPSKAKAEYWEKVNLPQSTQYTLWLDVFFLDENYGWACGRYNNNIARTTDGGVTWSISNLSGQFLERIHFADRNNGICSGPSGLFKTTDGGATWQGVSYINSKMHQISIWGCYMLSPDTMFVVGGGCLGANPVTMPYGDRVIWRSIDGGNTWENTVLDDKPAPHSSNTNYYSGLTHIIVYKNGTGYAVSSGLIWRTTDFGDNWNSFSRTADFLVWQESIAHIPGTNTFLVPYSGNDCPGGGNQGGMLFTNTAQVNANWKRHDVNTGPMYGAWLLSETEGWAAGLNRGVYHTRDAGNSWQLKNCGIDARDNLDDIFFLSPTKGWVVGDNIYRLAPTQVFVNRKKIDITTCERTGGIWDTVIVDIKTFNTSTLDIQIIKDNPNFHFVPAPSALRNQLGCSLARIIVWIPATTVGLHEFSYAITVKPNGETYEYRDTISYRVLIKEETIQNDIDTLDFGDVPVLSGKSGSVRWSSKDIDTISSFTVETPDSKLSRIYHSMPFVVTANSARQMDFEVYPQDTGVYFITYSFKISPCNQTKDIVLRVRGISPIIESETKNLLNVAACMNDTILKIPIYNTGNDTLMIYDFKVVFNDDSSDEEPTYSVEIMGFGSDYSKYGIKIKPKEFDTLYIKISSTESDTVNFNIVVNNNDRFRYASVYPYEISVSAIFKFPAVDKIQQIIDFGDVCVNTKTTQQVTVKNTGELTLTLPLPQTKISEFIFLNIPQLPKQIAPRDSIIYRIEFFPKSSGIFVDTVRIIAQPCNTEYEIILLGRGVVNDIEIAPQEINDRINVKIAKEYQFKIKSNSPQIIKIDSAKLLTVQDIDEISLLTNFPFDLQQNEEKIIRISAYSEEEKIVICELEIFYSSSCFDSLKIPLHIEFIDNQITYTDKNDNPVYKFSDNYTCKIEKVFDTIYVNNLQNYTFQSLRLARGLSEFEIENYSDLNLPKEILALSKIEIIVSFMPTVEGIYEEELVFEMMSAATNEVRFDTLYFSKTFRQTNTCLRVNENGFDFGLFELCESPIEKTLTIVNTGTLNDTCIFDFSNLPKCFAFVNDSLYFNNLFEIEVPALDSVSVKIILNPKNAEPKTIFSDFFMIRTKVCPQEFEINLKYISDEISLTVSSKTLDFGDVWINTVRNDTLIITNNSVFEIEITDFNLQPNIYFNHSETLPFTLKSGAFKRIPISFISDITGDFEATINIFANRFCEIQESLLLKATVPDERYTVEIIWNKTKAIPGENAVFEAVAAVYPANKLSPTQIDFHIKMDYKLFYPEKLFFIDANDNAIPLQFDYKFPAGVSSSLQGNAAKYALDFEKVFLRMEGLALLSAPKETQIEFEKFEITTEKIYTVEQIEGEFEIYGFCEYNGWRSNLKYLPTYEAEIPNIINSNNLEINFTATGEIAVTVEIVDLLGSNLHTEKVDLEKGEKQKNIDLRLITSGSYFIKFSSDYYLPIIRQVIIAK